MSKKSYVVVVLIGLVAIGLLVRYIGGDTEILPEPVVIIEMSEQGFSLKEADIKVGEAIKYVNVTDDGFFWPASDLHPTHELYSEFDPREPIGPGESWTFVFERVGTWQFHDHLRASQRGVIRVTR